MLDGHLPTKTISLIYKKLLNQMTDSLSQLRDKWAGDGLELDDEEWAEATASPKEVAITAKLCLVQLKILHRI